ncbi:hypothetical protein GUITHDRAFT_110986 [Guillardia theta CCMP2712]|uniref:Uncharacterized protein n=1 Tax=Guillardia theta (strain CCMP2712) TaxID=905079 RepID=L1J4C7_GUITC|nr:hypothetical protein GUITHDRAFT_110986 [Guillardia theta CCMP2712]EKX42940.1 hypothetical protein GUITHDRAFT_110986 [Guillardia theta CCMP2712]|eukprot:XP_005829920.1 hypothetical protein GUITHDRAFT_110986 [Guillardia theta CCMP2712]
MEQIQNQEDRLNPLITCYREGKGGHCSMGQASNSETLKESQQLEDKWNQLNINDTKENNNLATASTISNHRDASRKGEEVCGEEETDPWRFVFFQEVELSIPLEVLCSEASVFGLERAIRRMQDIHLVESFAFGNRGTENMDITLKLKVDLELLRAHMHDCQLCVPQEELTWDVWWRAAFCLEEYLKGNDSTVSWTGRRNFIFFVFNGVQDDKGSDLSFLMEDE